MGMKAAFRVWGWAEGKCEYETDVLSKFSKNVTFLVQSNCQGGGEAIAFRRQG
jgi:hypothetical protein